MKYRIVRSSLAESAEALTAVLEHTEAWAAQGCGFVSVTVVPGGCEVEFTTEVPEGEVESLGLEVI